MTGCSKTKYRQLLALSRPALVNSTCISQSLVRLRSSIYAICEYFILIQIQFKDSTVDVDKTLPKQFGKEKSNSASSLGNLRLEFVLVFETSV